MRVCPLASPSATRRNGGRGRLLGARSASLARVLEDADLLVRQVAQGDAVRAHDILVPSVVGSRAGPPAGRRARDRRRNGAGGVSGGQGNTGLTAPAGWHPAAPRIAGPVPGTTPAAAGEEREQGIRTVAPRWRKNQDRTSRRRKRSGPDRSAPGFSRASPGVPIRTRSAVDTSTPCPSAGMCAGGAYRGRMLRPVRVALENLSTRSSTTASVSAPFVPCRPSSASRAQRGRQAGCRRRLSTRRRHRGARPRRHRTARKCRGIEGRTPTPGGGQMALADPLERDHGDLALVVRLYSAKSGIAAAWASKPTTLGARWRRHGLHLGGRPRR
jgi:hypothetical protein